MARRPAQPEDDKREYPILALDPDFDDLPEDSTQGTDEDEITQEAVLRLAQAAIDEIARVHDERNADQAKAMAIARGEEPKE